MFSVMLKMFVKLHMTRCTALTSSVGLSQRRISVCVVEVVQITGTSQRESLYVEDVVSVLFVAKNLIIVCSVITTRKCDDGS